MKYQSRDELLAKGYKHPITDNGKGELEQTDILYQESIPVPEELVLFRPNNSQYIIKKEEYLTSAFLLRLGTGGMRLSAKTTKALFEELEYLYDAHADFKNN